MLIIESCGSSSKLRAGVGYIWFHVVHFGVSCVGQLCLPYGIFYLEIYDARRYFLTLVHGVRIYIERSPMENPICERALSVLFVHLIVVECNQCNHSFYVNLFIFYTLDIIYNTTILLLINGWFQLRGNPERLSAQSPQCCYMQCVS